MRWSVFVFPMLLSLHCLAGGAAVVAPTLVADPAGGWRTVGLPYNAHFSASGYLDSLQVGGFEFLAPSHNPAHGLYFATGETRLPFTSAELVGDALVVGTDQARLTVRCLPDRLEIAAENLGMDDGMLGRLELSKAVARIKSPDTGVEYALPPPLVSEKMRLIAPSGASLTLPGTYLYPQGEGYLVKLPWLRAGAPPVTWALQIAPRPLLDDALKIEGKAATEDCTYWSGGPQPFTTTVTNLSGGPFRGGIVLQVRHYLTKQARELRQPLELDQGGSKTLSWTLDGLDPAVYLVEVWVVSGAERRLVATTRLVYNAGAIAPPPLPDDFDAFWKATLQEQAEIPLDLKMTKVKEQGKSEVYKFNFAGLLGYRIYGYLTVPLDKSKQYPAELILPSSGLHAIAMPVFPEDDRVGMAINITDMDVDLPPEDYDWRTWPAPYLVTGILEKEYYSLRFSYAGMVRATEVLAARPEVQADNILVTGSSQGGGLTLVAAGLYPHYRAAVANVPGLCRLDWNFEILNPPYFPIAASAETKPMVSTTLKYFDAAQFARRVTCPIWVSMGLRDDVTPAMGVFCAYNAIPGDKHLLVQPLAGHSGGWGPQATEGVWP